MAIYFWYSKLYFYNRICSSNLRASPKSRRDLTAVTHIYSQMDCLFFRILLVDHFALNQPHHRTAKILFSFRLGTPIRALFHANDALWTLLYFGMPSVCSLSWHKISLTPRERKSNNNYSCSFD